MKHDLSTLHHLLQTGELGQLKIGMPLYEMLVYLGEPDLLPNASRSPNMYYRYGCLSVTTRGNSVTGFAMNIFNFPEYGLPERFNIGWLAYLATMSYEAFVTLIHSHTNDNFYDYMKHYRTMWRLGNRATNTASMLTIVIFHVKESEDAIEHRQIIIC